MKNMQKRKEKNMMVLVLGALLVGSVVQPFLPAEVSAQESAHKTSVTKKNYIAQQTANVRTTASMNAKVIEWLPKGAVVEALGQSGKWVKVKHDGKTGYVSVKTLKSISTASALKAKKAYMEKQLKGFKKVSSNKFTHQANDKKPLVTVVFEQGTTDKSTLHLDGEQAEKSIKSFDEYHNMEKAMDSYLDAYFGKSSDQVKKLKKDMEDFGYKTGYSKAKTYKIDGYEVFVDQTEGIYETTISIKKETTAQSYTMTSKGYYQANKTAKLYDGMTNGKKELAKIPVGTRLVSTGEQKKFVYVSYKGKQGFVKKSDVIQVEKTVSKYRQSRADMEKVFGQSLKKVSANEYRLIVKGEEKPVLSIYFKDANATTPILREYDTFDYHKELNGYNAEDTEYPMKAFSKQSREIGMVEVVEGEVGIISKEEILHSKAVMKKANQVVKAFAEVQFGKGTMASKKLQKDILREGNQFIYFESGEERLHVDEKLIHYGFVTDYFIK